MKIEKEFFLPYIAGYLGNTLERAEEQQRKFEEFAPLAKVAHGGQSYWRMFALSSPKCSLVYNIVHYRLF